MRSGGNAREPSLTETDFNFEMPIIGYNNSGGIIMTTPRPDGYFMPGEWHPHTACWMTWPCAADTFSKAPLDLKAAHMAAKKCYAAVAKVISCFEPVYMLTNRKFQK